MMLWIPPHPWDPPHPEPFTGIRRTNEPSGNPPACIRAVLCSSAKRRVRHLNRCLVCECVCVCVITSVYMNMHAVCVRRCRGYASVGRRRRWRQVNPALRLSINISDQTINNSDSSLSGSITEHRLRGSRGTEVIYSRVQLTHTNKRWTHVGSLRNCALRSRRPHKRGG